MPKITNRISGKRPFGLSQNGWHSTTHKKSQTPTKKHRGATRKKNNTKPPTPTTETKTHSPKTMFMRKSVSFDCRVRIRDVPSIDDISTEEFNASWLSQDEYSQIRKRERKLARKVTSTGDLKALRNEIGLETKQEKSNRRTRVDNGKFTVLLEQERQWDEQAYDPELIAEIYADIAKESVEVARSRALDTALQVEVLLPAIDDSFSGKEPVTGTPPSSPMAVTGPEVTAASVVAVSTFSPETFARRTNGSGKILEQPLVSPCPHRWRTSVTDSALAQKKKKLRMSGLVAPSRG